MIKKVNILMVAVFAIALLVSSTAFATDQPEVTVNGLQLDRLAFCDLNEDAFGSSKNLGVSERELLELRSELCGATKAVSSTQFRVEVASEIASEFEPWVFSGLESDRSSRDICFCSGTCTSLGNCLWGSCSGSLSCCIDCWSDGCDAANCGGSTIGGAY